MPFVLSTDVVELFGGRAKLYEGNVAVNEHAGDRWTVVIDSWGHHVTVAEFDSACDAEGFAGALRGFIGAAS